MFDRVIRVLQALRCGATGAAALTAASADAQTCAPEWQALGSGMDAQVNVVATWDAALSGGSILIAGGPFTTAGGVPASHLAQWNGSSWAPLGDGVGGRIATVFALSTFADGPNPNHPAFYVGGEFSLAGAVPVSNIARWDSAAWTNVGGGVSGGDVLAFAVFDDDGAGPHAPALYVGGEFTSAGGARMNRIARWDGASWSALGSGIGGDFPFVSALAVFDEDGDGPEAPALFVGGAFTSAGGATVQNVAKWNGATWSNVGGGTSGFVDDFVVFGAELYATGAFASAGGATANGIARWNGATWTSVGGGLNAPGFALAVFDDDGGGPGAPALFVGGTFTQAGGLPASRVARWNGTNWSALGAGVNGQVLDMTASDIDGARAAPASLVVGGVFSSASGVPAARIGQWVGCETSAEGDLDGDGDVDAVDLATMLGSWGPCPGACAADLDGDGDVDAADLAVLLGSWGA